ncbi:MAG: aa3 type cytochrome c oxidase subunit [Phenylobacterium sp.]|nr:aa3 type cytochrome c oxidase subunit [Phenylobacterium sp.]
MANQVSDYHRGQMDIHEQAATYQRVMAMSKWGSLIIGAAVLFLTLWFCTGTGFVGAAITGAVVIALGVFLLRGGDAH